MRIAVLDDYQSVARSFADWAALERRAEVTVFTDHLADEDAVAQRLSPFDIVCIMRERTPLPRSLIERLPKLKFIASTGRANAAIDVKAAEARGITIAHTGYGSAPTVELAWALILACQRNIVIEAQSVAAGGWQRTVGRDLHGRTLGLLGVGNIGSRVAQVGNAFGMRVIGWSENLTAEKAQASGVSAVTKEALFAQADILSIHVVLSHRTRGLVDGAMLGLMQPEAWLVNTSRGPIVDEPALLAALHEHRIAGYAVDVYGTEPLPAGHPFRTLPNVLATPHIGYVTEDLYRTFYGDCVRNITQWLDSQPK